MQYGEDAWSGGRNLAGSGLPLYLEKRLKSIVLLDFELMPWEYRMGGKSVGVDEAILERYRQAYFKERMARKTHGRNNGALSIANARNLEGRGSSMRDMHRSSCMGMDRHPLGSEVSTDSGSEEGRWITTQSGHKVFLDEQDTVQKGFGGKFNGLDISEVGRAASSQAAYGGHERRLQQAAYPENGYGVHSGELLRRTSATQGRQAGAPTAEKYGAGQQYHDSDGMMVAQLHGLKNFVEQFRGVNIPSEIGNHEQGMELNAISDYFLSDKKLTEGLTPGSTAYKRRIKGLDDNSLTYKPYDFRQLASLETTMTQYATSPNEMESMKAKREYLELLERYNKGTLPPQEEHLLRIIPPEEWNENNPYYRPDVRPGLSVKEAIMMSKHSDLVASWRRSLELCMENEPDALAYLCRLAGTIYGDKHVQEILSFLWPDPRKKIKAPKVLKVLYDTIFSGLYDSDGYLQ